MNRMDLISAWAHILRVPEKDIIQLVKTAPYQYRHYQIPKRTGGMRDIHHPTPSLKTIQRWLVSELFSSLPIHHAVHSYRPDHNIRKHAAKHLHSNFLLRLDFKDFFPSIDLNWLTAYLRSEILSGRLPLDEGALDVVTRVICRIDETKEKAALSIGAPSSPTLSNSVLFELDNAIFDLASTANCVYTRYADDIFISSKERDTLGPLETEVRRLIEKIAPKLSLNELKTANVSKKHKRVVTGINLTPDRKLSIGRELKRSIKTRIYLKTVERLSTSESERLGGLLAYVRDVEPEFFSALKTKFGAEILDTLLHRNL